MQVGHQRAVRRRQRAKRPVELLQQLQRLRPGWQAEPRGVAAAVAGVVDGADHDRRVRPHQGAQTGQHRPAVGRHGLDCSPRGGTVAVGV
jgi:hypothetical protein